jgi:nucleotide-binding universal stress UspA family protein
MNPPDEPLDQAVQTIGASTLQPKRSGIRALLAIDSSSRSVESAEFLAGILPSDSKVRMLTVVSYQAQSDSPWSRLSDADEAGAQMAATQSGVFSRARRILETAGAQVSATHRFGYPADEILNEASDWGADFILVGHHNGLARWFLGSVTESIVKRSHVPVLVVPRLSLSEDRKRAAQESSASSIEAALFLG